MSAPKKKPAMPKTGKMEGTNPSGMLSPDGKWYPCAIRAHLYLEDRLAEALFDPDEECQHDHAKRQREEWAKHNWGSWTLDCQGHKWNHEHGKPGNHPECMRRPTIHHTASSCLHDDGWLHVSGQVMAWREFITRAQRDVLIDYYLENAEALREAAKGWPKSHEATTIKCLEEIIADGDAE